MNAMCRECTGGLRNGELIVHLCPLHAQTEALREALREIVNGAGEFNLDPLIHATNCIESMREIARQALAATKETL